MVFSSPDCPIANALAPEIERLHALTLREGGVFFLVHARADVTPSMATEHAKAYAITAPILLDTDQRLVKQLDATVTPEVFVVRLIDGGDYEVVYHGLINNLYASLGNRRDRATEHFARQAIVAAAGGETVQPAYRPPLGCFLERTQ